jgi:hypothetical protein
VTAAAPAHSQQQHVCTDRAGSLHFWPTDQRKCTPAHQTAAHCADPLLHCRLFKQAARKLTGTIDDVGRQLLQKTDPKEPNEVRAGQWGCQPADSSVQQVHQFTERAVHEHMGSTLPLGTRSAV